MLSLPLTGMGNGVGVVGLSGRNMVLNPVPANVPTNAASGPRLGAGVPTPAVAGRTSSMWKSLGSAMPPPVSLIGSLMTLPSLAGTFPCPFSSKLGIVVS